MTSRYTNFMKHKPFHPANYQNRKRVWEAEQRELTDQKKRETQRKQVESEKKQFDAVFQSPQNQGLSKSEALKMTHLGFMYNAPKLEKSESKDSDKKKLSKQEEREEKFSILKNAPREGTYTENMDLTFKPFGVILKNVKCLRCQQWGHAVTDRECPKYKDESKYEEERKLREDPLFIMENTNNTSDEIDRLQQEQDDLAWIDGLDKKDKKKLFNAFKEMGKSQRKSKRIKGREKSS